ncbi:unnamed protein product, partial [Eruca vesicaria subsp. sativa]|nr:unnamed protein product [Eruca vesicaria subsp. sativa]
MESTHLSGQETIPASQDESSLQVSGETNLLSQNSDEFLAKKKDATISDDDASINDFDEKEDISNNEDYLQIVNADALE